MSVNIIDPLDPDLRALRTIQSPHHVHPNVDQTAYRITSGAFIPGSDGTVSVDLEESLQRSGMQVTALYPGIEKAVAMVGHPIGLYTASGYNVVHQPVAGNDHHGSASTTLKNNALRKVARAFADAAQFVVPIDREAAERFGAEPLQRP